MTHIDSSMQSNLKHSICLTQIDTDWHRLTHWQREERIYHLFNLPQHSLTLFKQTEFKNRAHTFLNAAERTDIFETGTSCIGEPCENCLNRILHFVWLTPAKLGFPEVGRVHHCDTEKAKGEGWRHWGRCRQRLTLICPWIEYTACRFANASPYNWSELEKYSFWKLTDPPREWSC